MIIILEGIDKTGKTTLSKKIKELFPSFELMKVSQPKTADPFLEYCELILSLDITKNYIFDRMYLGERAYGPIYRQHDLTDVQHFYLELLLLKHGVFFIYITLNDDMIRTNFKNYAETFTATKDICDLRVNYTFALAKSIFDIQYYNYLYGDQMLFTVLFNWVNSYKRHVQVTFQFLGNLSAKYLFIGDKLNENVKNPYVFNSSSGFFLLSALKNVFIKNQFSLQEILIFNSTDIGEVIKNFSFILDKQKKIIVLGKNAEKKVLPFIKEYKRINHPQFAKRFLGINAQSKYEQEILSVLI